MPGLSEFSWGHLNTCRQELRDIVEEVAEIYEIRVLCGRRTWDEQRRLLAEGRTKVGPGQSKHNPPTDGDVDWLSNAVDVVPYPIDWKDAKRFVYMAGLMMGVARQFGVTLRWGGNWDMDMEIIDDQSFDDLPHFELVE